MKFLKSIFPLLLAVSIAFSCEGIVMAAKSLSQLQQEMAERSKKMKETEVQIKAKETEKDAQIEKRIELDTQISAIEADIDDVEVVIAEKSAEIEEKNKRIEELQKIIDDNREKLKYRIRVMYEYGNVSYLEILLQSDGFGDLLTRLSLLKDIVSHDQEVINTYVNSQTEIEEAKQIVIKERDEQVNAKKILL